MRRESAAFLKYSSFIFYCRFRNPQFMVFVARWGSEKQAWDLVPHPRQDPLGLQLGIACRRWRPKVQVRLHFLYRTFRLLIFLNASTEKEGSPPLKPEPLSSSSCLGFCRSSLELTFFYLFFFFSIFSLYVHDCQSAFVDPWVGKT